MSKSMEISFHKVTWEFRFVREFRNSKRNHKMGYLSDTKRIF